MTVQKVTDFIRQKTILFYFERWSSWDQLSEGLLAPLLQGFLNQPVVFSDLRTQEKMTLAC